MPKVSIIMGVYNAHSKDILKESIDSILNQTFQDFEFIICDDGSTNNTMNWIKELVQNDSRCKFIKHRKNEGLAQSLNDCLQISNGEYIARMDSDDISVLTRLEDEVSFLDKNPNFVLVSGYAELFDDNGTYGIRKNKSIPEKKDMLFGPPFIHAAMMMKKNVLDELNGYRVCRETLRTEDYDLWMRVYQNGYKGYNLQKVIYKIREDKYAYGRRKYRYRFDEAKVRYNGFKHLNLLPLGYIYVLKPFIVGLIPQRVLRILRNEK